MYAHSLALGRLAFVPKLIDILFQQALLFVIGSSPDLNRTEPKDYEIFQIFQFCGNKTICRLNNLLHGLPDRRTFRH